jgi:hypothetical protein
VSCREHFDGSRQEHEANESGEHAHEEGEDVASEEPDGAVHKNGVLDILVIVVNTDFWSA